MLNQMTIRVASVFSHHAILYRQTLKYNVTANHKQRLAPPRSPQLLWIHKHLMQCQALERCLLIIIRATWSVFAI